MLNFTKEDIHRIIDIAWEDRATFGTTEIQSGLKVNDVREIIRCEMKASSFKM